MSKPRGILAIDAGQTGIRAALKLVDGSGSPAIISQHAGLRTDLELFPQLAQVVSSSLENHQGQVSVAIGMSGLTKANSDPAALLALMSPQVTSVHLSHDSISGFLASMGNNQGTVTAVGTGVVTLSVGPTAFSRVDGWGHLIGDAGSAYWIGRAGLEAGMKSYDGRIAPSKLLDLITGNFTGPEEAYIELQTNPNRVSLIASFAKAVIDLASSDAAAMEIVTRAGAELALAAVTAAGRAGVLEQEQPRFSWAGNVMKAQLLRQSFVDEVSKKVPAASFHEPLAEPIDGVALLPNLGDDSPLSGAVFRVTRK